MVSQERAPLTRADRTLRYAAIAYAAGFAWHNLDHLRRGFSVLRPEVLGAGSALAVISVAALVMVLRGHRAAPLAAVAVGFAGALGVAASHLLPQWSSFSDAFPGGGVDALSWAAVLAEIAGALALGLAGLYALRSNARMRLAAARA